MIPQLISILSKPETLLPDDVAESGTIPGGIGDGDISPRVQNAHPQVRPGKSGPVPVSSGVMAGMLVQKTVPSYPPIAKASGTQGTVVLTATISRNGIIENLHVVSGSQMLQQAALDAVKTWRYRPYLLNGEPVDVETTISVVFTLRD
jgi:protein TonB